MKQEPEHEINVYVWENGAAIRHVSNRSGGHPRNPRFLLGHYELSGLLSDMELLRYREGIVDYGGGKRAWRATALARRTA